jgi:hypothetical protein
MLELAESLIAAALRPFTVITMDRMRTMLAPDTCNEVDRRRTGTYGRFGGAS